MKVIVGYLFIFLLSSSFALNAEDVIIGRVVTFRGTVEKMKNGVLTQVIAGANLFEGDRIKTGKGSFVKLLMNDDSIFQLGPETSFNFDKFKLKSKSERQATFSLLKGQLRSLIRVKAKDDRSITINTPSVSMGVRGTEILSNVFDDKGQSQTQIALLSGKLVVDISKMNIPNLKEISLEKGFSFDSSNFTKNIQATNEQQLVKKMAMPEFKKLRDDKGAFLSVSKSIRSRINSATGVKKEKSGNNENEPRVMKVPSKMEKSVVTHEEIPKGKQDHEILKNPGDHVPKMEKPRCKEVCKQHCLPAGCRTENRCTTSTVAAPAGTNVTPQTTTTCIPVQICWPVKCSRQCKKECR